MQTLTVKTCDEFWRELLADESAQYQEQKRLEVAFVVYGWTRVRDGEDIVTLTGGGIWGHNQQSDPISITCGEHKVLSEEIRILFNDDSVVELLFNLETFKLSVFVDGANRGSHLFTHLSHKSLK